MIWGFHFRKSFVMLRYSVSYQSYALEAWSNVYKIDFRQRSKKNIHLWILGIRRNFIEILYELRYENLKFHLVGVTMQNHIQFLQSCHVFRVVENCLINTWKNILHTFSDLRIPLYRRSIKKNIRNSKLYVFFYVHTYKYSIYKTYFLCQNQKKWRFRLLNQM